MVELRRMRWYDPKSGSFGWTEVPKSDQDALSLLPHPGLHGYLPVLAGVGCDHHGGASASGRASHRRARLATTPLRDWLCLRRGAVFFDGPPDLVRVGEGGEAGPVIKKRGEGTELLRPFSSRGALRSKGVDDQGD